MGLQTVQMLGHESFVVPYGRLPAGELQGHKMAIFGEIWEILKQANTGFEVRKIPGAVRRHE